MNAVWDLFFDTKKPIFPKRSATEEVSRTDDRKRGADNCQITAEVWKSAIYLGPGGPLVRDR